MADNLSNTAMKGQVKFQETVKYKGDLRIIGQVVVNNKTVGYVIMTEKNQQFKIYNEAQTKILLQRFKFVNAELQGDKIVNTECSMNSIMKFNTNMQVIGNHGITILAKISVNGKQYGYRAMDHNAKVVDLTEEELIKLKQLNTNIINAKIVNKNGKEFVSAIKGEFTQIDKKSIDEMKIKKDSPESKWRKERRAYKLENIWCHTILRKAMVGSSANWFPYWSFTYRPYNWDTHTPADYNFGKTIEIMAKEVVPKYIKTDEHKRVLKKLLDTYLHLTDKHTKPDSNNHNNVMLSVGLAQFVLVGNKDVYNRILRRPSTFIRNSVYDQLYNAGLTIHEFDGLYLDVEKACIAGSKKRTRKEFNNCAFKSAKDCAQIGFAINAKDKGMKYTTECGHKYTLKYVGDYLPNYESYKKMARCLGDVLVLAQIERLRDTNYFENNEKLAREEIMLAIMSLYRPDIVKIYMDNNSERYLGLDMLPGIDLGAVTDFGLSDDLRVYYESGFNVFLNDNGMSGPYDSTRHNTRIYRRGHIINSKYINLRSLGVGVKSLHNMLYDELATIIGMITSNRVSIEDINNVIGALRML